MNTFKSTSSRWTRRILSIRIPRPWWAILRRRSPADSLGWRRQWRRNRDSQVISRKVEPLTRVSCMELRRPGREPHAVLKCPHSEPQSTVNLVPCVRN